MPNGVQRNANMDSLMAIAWEFDGTTYHGLYSFVRYLEKISQQTEEMGEVNLSGEEENVVRIMTIHKSKGLEYNAVYFIGLEDSAFWNFRNQPDEDRCTFFVALSRAKASVTFTFCKKRTGMKCPMQRHNAINEFFDLLQRPGIAEVKRFQNR